MGGSRYYMFKRRLLIKWTGFFLVVVFISTVSFAQAEEIVSIKPEVGLAGDIVEIEGTFGIRSNNSYVEFIDSSETKYKAEIKEWSEKKIKVIVPFCMKREIVKVQVILGEKVTNQKGFGVYPINLIEESIHLKRKGVSDSTIVDHLYHMGELGCDNCTIKESFGNIRLTKDGIEKLKEAGFQDDFIAKFEGHPQYVTLGVAGIWLTETTDLAAAPMLRIFLVPRGYFEERPPF